jgi:hypothetical protein
MNVRRILCLQEKRKVNLANSDRCNTRHKRQRCRNHYAAAAIATEAGFLRAFFFAA